VNPEMLWRMSLVMNAASSSDLPPERRCSPPGGAGKEGRSQCGSPGVGGGERTGRVGEGIPHGNSRRAVRVPSPHGTRDKGRQHQKGEDEPVQLEMTEGSVRSVGSHWTRMRRSGDGQNMAGQCGGQDRGEEWDWTTAGGGGLPEGSLLSDRGRTSGGLGMALGE
jgi:hypothetical protein